MNRLPILLLLGLFACPMPKAGDDRLPLVDDSGTGDTGKVVDDSGSEPTDSGEPVPDSGDDDGGAPPPDSGETMDTGVACVPTGPEVCDNGLDDDCQNGADCADPVCGSCVPTASGFAMGLIVSTRTACPPGFEVQTTPIFGGLSPGVGCAGSCACAPDATRCLGELFIYSTEAECMNDNTLTGGQLYTALITPTCTAKPVAFGFPGGYRWGSWTIQQSCTPSGTAAPTPYTWGQQMIFCTAQAGLHGCDANSVCVPPAERACLMTSGGATCPEPFSVRETDWFTGVSDSRSCGPCECGAAGGGCQSVQIALGSDYVCTDGAFVSQSSARSCGSAYSPPARTVGTPTDPTCTAGSQQSGSIEGTGQQTICCQP